MEKILFLNTCVEWGGGEKWTFDTADELDNRGYQVIIGSVAESELFTRAKKAGIKTKEVAIRNTLSVLNPVKLIAFINYLKQEKIDTIFLNLSQDLKFGALAAKLAGVERIIYRRGIDIPIKDRFYTKFLLADCVTDIIVNSQATKASVLKNTDDYLDESKINIIYNGIKLEKIAQREITSDIREEFKLSEDIPLIANVGRLTEQKGHKYLLQAVDLMREQLQEFKVLIVGKGELEQQLKNEVKELGLEDYIIFTGFRKDVYNIMQQMDFLLHTALWEGFGFVIAEAMAVAKPVVACDSSNISELVIDGETGYLAEVKNPEDIAQKAIKMIKNENKESLGKQARKRVEKKFVFKDKVSQLEEKY